MSVDDRLAAMCKQEPGDRRVTGIDFVRVVDPADQTVLQVFFYVDPDTLIDPIVQAADIPADVPASTVVIESVSGGESIARVPVVGATYRKTLVSGSERTVLEVQTARPGDFSIYRLTVLDEQNRIDRFFNGVQFSFKQGCPGRYDCKPAHQCPSEESDDVAVDYLARDFQSIRNALLDFASQRYPDWREQTPADVGIMLAEVVSALGDELSYVQDRYGRESYLETLSERRSLRWLTRLVDYDVDEGESATTVLAVNAIAGAFAEAGMRVWARQRGCAAIPFEVGRRLADQRDPRFQTWIHPQWNSIEVHVPDGLQPCLPMGSTELYLKGAIPLAGQLPPDGSDASTFWKGRDIVIRMVPKDRSLDERRHLVRVTDTEITEDPLCIVNGAPAKITRIEWSVEQALPFELCLRDAMVSGNIVPAVAGETFTEFFVISKNEEIPVDRRVVPALEREGVCDEQAGDRSIAFLHSLQQTEFSGLGWSREGSTPRPEVELEEVEPTTLEPENIARRDFWDFQPSLLKSAADSPVFTLDAGTWRRVIGFHVEGELFEHRDYASGAGFSLRFGDGIFGSVPADGRVFRVRYRSGPGEGANLPADTVRLLSDPTPDPLSSWPTLAGIADSVTNPFPVSNGRDSESAAVVKKLAPEAFRALPLRAVRDEDYREIVERLLDWVQRAGATARWTGSWLTEFATADPFGAFSLSAEHRAALENVLDCIRQVGRDVYVRDPVYVNLDLEIKVCVSSDAYPGQVEESAVVALTGPGGFFAPDNFTFGTPLRRAAMEAAIQRVAGVTGVEEMCLRIRGSTPLKRFDALVLHVADDEIIRLQNDPLFPERGSLRVRTVTDLSCLEEPV